MTAYELVKKISKDTDISEEHVDAILTETTNTLNRDFLNGDNQLANMMKLAKKKVGLPLIIETVTKNTELPSEEVSQVVQYVVKSLATSLKTGGAKALLKTMKQIKRHKDEIIDELV